ncbi:MAG TPA: Asp-tRNA(Asn)/Glu-tRNA(Gln) amidotransferase subunit GatA [candidate division Zixibacteria bacterium]|nr:Asp-tRNA(Asn)/Glu-tRNA(Gln) amidotransferase subunit GatA [candidate division Zixibacteria bacterium]
MDTADYKKLTISAIGDGLSSGAFSAVELAQTALALAEREGAELNCYITLCRDKALAQAAAVDKKIAAGEPLGPLAGVPVAVKDNISYTDYLTSCGSKILEGYIPPYDATVVKNLLAADAVIIGKTNLDEFAMGSSNENSAFGPVKNPINHAYAPGGSSGGSAVSVAAGLTPVSLGSETGGSVRQPAAFCGILGLKPTYGAVSRFGLVAFGSSLDQIGPFARTTADLARIYQVIAGRDTNDSTSVAHEHEDYSAALQREGKYTIGLPKECFAEGVDSEVLQRLEEFKETLSALGHTFKDVSLPLTPAGVACYYIIAPAEASSNLARFDGVKYGLRLGNETDLLEMYKETRGAGFGAEVKRRIMLGTYVLSAGYYDAYYLKGMKVRELIRRDLERVFSEVDVILTPTTPTAAFKLGEKTDDPLAMYLSDVFTVVGNLTGTPGLSVPAGTVSGGLPVGAQFIAPHFQEARLFELAAQVERHRGTG